MSDESLLALRNGMLYSAITLQKYRFDPKELEKHIERIFRSINPHLGRNFLQTIIDYTLQVADITETKIVEIAQKISPEIKNNVMSTYDQLIKKGEIKGEIKGILEGKLEVILKGFDSGLNITLLANITTLSEDQVIEILQKNGKID